MGHLWDQCQLRDQCLLRDMCHLGAQCRLGLFGIGGSVDLGDRGFHLVRVSSIQNVVYLAAVRDHDIFY
jgi:hypothetical protein